MRPRGSPKASTSSGSALSSRERPYDPTEPSHDRRELASSKSMILPDRKYDLSRERWEKRHSNLPVGVRNEEKSASSPPLINIKRVRSVASTPFQTVCTEVVGGSYALR